MKRLIFGMMVAGTLGVMQAAAEDSKDTNGDGKISKQEFLTARAARAKQAGREVDAAADEELFKKLDKNEDGVLTSDELYTTPKNKKTETSP